MNKNCMASSKYCPLQSFLWIPIRRDRHPSTITWHQIKRQRRACGKNNIRISREAIQKKKT